MWNHEESYTAEAHGMSLGRMYGRRQGYDEGFDAGYQQGLNDGYQRGQQDGYNTGWTDAVNKANVQILKQLEYTREHVAGKNELQALLCKQRDLNEQLQARVEALTKEKADILLAAATAGEKCKAAISEFRQALTASETKLRKRTKEYVEQLWQYNRTLIFMNAVRGVLDELTNEESGQADQVRQLFADKYAHQVRQGLEDGAIKLAPELDDAFARALPKTRQFIVETLAKHEGK